MGRKNNKPKKSIRLHSRVLGLVLLCALLAVALITGFEASYAWLSGSSQVDNVIIMPKLSVSVEESNDGDDYSGWTDPGIDWLEPVPKYTRFTNTGQASVVIRVSYAQFWTVTAGDVQYLSNIYDGQPVASPLWTADGFDNAALWDDFGDGWYYYRRVLAPGESTAAVLEAVAFLEAAAAAYADAAYTLDFMLEAAQYSANPDNENQLAVWEIFGKTYAESAGSLTWSSTAP